MSNARRLDVPTLVLGSGAAACAAAVVLARRGTPVTLAGRANTNPPPRIDAVPLQTLAALVELGLHPIELGVSGTSDGMLSAWEGPQPTFKPTAPRVHVDRQRLDRAVAVLACRTPRLRVDPNARPEDFERVLDATGRRARTAARIHRADPGWIAQVRCFDGRFLAPARALRVAALPIGYAYRLGTEERISLGLVTSRDAQPLGGSSWTDLLGRAGARWMIDGLDEEDSGAQARGGPCSLQWAEAGTAALIGDSAFAPDALAGQGLSRAIAAGLSSGVGPLEDSISSHCSKLRQAIANSRWRSAPCWQGYRASIARLEAEAAIHFGAARAAAGSHRREPEGATVTKEREPN